MANDSIIETNAPARLDRLPWSRFHWQVVTALGVAWILDGLEVTLVGALSAALKDPRALDLTESQIGLTASAYLIGAVIGAVVFGRLSDAFGRRRLFFITVGLYLAATVASGLSWNFAAFAFFRFLTGAGIGGEYAAINSAVQELIPARRRGVTDLTINGSWWVGAALGSLGSVVVLNPHVFPAWLGWRVAFLLGAVLGVIIILIRRYIPESPRWLMTHGRAAEAHAVVCEIEGRLTADGRLIEPEETARSLRLMATRRGGWLDIAHTLIVAYPRRTLVGLSLMTSQAFCYNAIFFTYALILSRFYGVPAAAVGWYLLPFALGNFLGPLLLGHFFDLDRPPGNDRRDLRDRRRPAGAHRLALRPGAAHGRRADRGLDGDLLLRLRGGKRGLPHGGRVLPDRDSRRRDRAVLRCRHGRRRRRGAGRVWSPDREWLEA